MTCRLYSKISSVILICNLVVVNFMAAQTASGTIKFQTDNGQTTSVQATATALFNSSISYSLNGDANSPISFSTWDLANAMAVDNYALKNKLQFFKNPSDDLNILLNTTDNLKAVVFDINGKAVCTPKILKQANGMTRIYHSLNSLANGVYFVKIMSDGIKGSLKFVKRTSVKKNTLSKYTHSQKTNSFLKTNGSPNYTISWHNVPGIADGNTDVEILSGSSNSFTIPVTTIYDQHKLEMWE